ncbi:MAG: hypothetical protein ACLQVI_08355 [Polyangiaceae bacterium]
MSLVRTARARCALLCAAVLASLLVLLFSPDARAQTPAVTGIVGAVLRLEPNGSSADSFSTGNPHPGGVAANVVNYEDCEANLNYQFTLSLSGLYPQYDLVAWAGPDDCTAAAARESPTATCWPLTAGPIVQGGGVDDAGAPTTTVTLRMQDITSNAGVTSAINPSYAPATNAACSAQTDDVASSIAVYFFFTDHVAPGDAIGVAQAYPLTVDTRAQTIGESGFTVAEGLDTQLTVNITVAPDPSTVVFNIYCDPPPGQESTLTQVPYDAATNNGLCVLDSGSIAIVDSATDALSSVEDSGPEDAATVTDSASTIVVGTDDAGGNRCGVTLNDAGIPTSGTAACSGSSVLQPGGGSITTTLVPETDDSGTDVTAADGGIVYVEAGVATGGTMTLGIPTKYLCGTVAATNPTYTITGLKDGYYYTIAVAAVDGAGNVGPLAVTCQEPVQLADFWYQYTASGGQAGGGYCSTAEGVGVPAGTSGLGLLAIASVIAAVRKRRR